MLNPALCLGDGEEIRPVHLVIRGLERVPKDARGLGPPGDLKASSSSLAKQFNRGREARTIWVLVLPCHVMSWRAKLNGVKKIIINVFQNSRNHG